MMGIIKNLFKKINSKEYLEIKEQIGLLWIEIDILSQRYKRKVKPPEAAPKEMIGSGIEDGFNELRNINKEHPPK